MSFVVAIGMATGCAQTPTTAQQSYDPLHGVRTPPGAPVPPHAHAPTATTSTVQPQQQALNGTPPSTGPNPASLAGPTWQSPLGRPVSLDQTGGPPFFPANQSRTQPGPMTPGFMPPNTNPRVEPVPDMTPASPPNVVPTGSVQASWSSGPGVVTANAAPVADLTRQLQARGVINQKLDQTPQGPRWTFYISRGAAGITIAQPDAADYTAAAQAVLRELDR